MATNQSPGLPETLATAYNPGMCLLALPVIVLAAAKERKKGERNMKQKKTIRKGLVAVLMIVSMWSLTVFASD